MSTDGVMVAPPRVNLRGVVTTAEPKKMSLWTEKEIIWVLQNRWKQLSRQVSANSVEVDWIGFQREVESGIARRMRREFQVEPLILCLVQPAPGGTPAYKGRVDEEPKKQPISKRADFVRKDSGMTSNQNDQSRLASTFPSSKTNIDNDQVDEPAGRTRRRRSAIG